MTPSTPPPWKVGLIITIGILAVSASAIFIRLAFQASGEIGVGFSLVLAASRLTVAALLFIPAWKNLGWPGTWSSGWRFSVGAGIFLALHFACWITSLAYTSIAASTALVTTNPVWMALLSWLWFKEKPGRQMTIGIAIALVGSLMVSLGGSGADGLGLNPPLGNGLALAGSWAVTLYFLLGREAQRQGLNIASHAALTYTTAALVLLPLPLLFGYAYTGYPPLVYLCIALIAIFPQAIGHTSLNWAVRWVSPTLVTLTILAEPVGSSLLGLLVFQENPGPIVWVGAATILMGVMIAALNQTSSKTPA